MIETPDAAHEAMDFALLPLGDGIVPAVPLRRMPQDAVLTMSMAPPGGAQFLAARELLRVALVDEDMQRFEELDWGDSLNTVSAFLMTQVAGGYPAMEIDLDAELKDLVEDE